MKITIEVNSMKELQSVLEGMMVYSPEKKVAEKKEEREKVEMAKVKSNYDELHRQIIALHKERKKAAEIAKITKCSPATVYNHIKRHEQEVEA